MSRVSAERRRKRVLDRWDQFCLDVGNAWGLRKNARADCKLVQLI